MKNTFLRHLSWGLALLLLQGAALAESLPLRIGILPTLSPRVLLKNYEYMRHYLMQELRQPMQLGTAIDFRAFHHQVMNDEYDIVVTAAHLARLAQREKGWVPLATYTAPLRAMLLVANKSTINSIEDIRGKMITSADPLALVVIHGQQWLLEKGLRQNRDYQYVDAPSFTSAVHAVLKQQAALVIVSPSSYRQLPEPLKNETHVFQTLPEIPALIWLVNPKSRIDPARLKAALLKFTAEIPEGREFYGLTGYVGLREISSEQMQGLDKYADEAKSLLSAKH